MFRKPRNSDGQDTLPSVGRCPSPPGTALAVSAPLLSSRLMATTKTSRAKSSQKQISSFFGKTTAEQAHAQRQGRKPNESILKFFQKVDSPAHFEQDLFVSLTGDDQENSVKNDAKALEDEDYRYNETGFPSKRRRIDDDRVTQTTSDILPHNESSCKKEGPREPTANSGSLRPTNNPFAEDSDSEDSGEALDTKKLEDLDNHITNPTAQESVQQTAEAIPIENIKSEPPSTETPVPAPLLRKDTSWITNDDLDQFGDLEADEFYENGEEYIERRYMEEQAALEQEFEQDEATPIKKQSPFSTDVLPQTESACPICGSSLGGLSDEETSVHVNNCLDENPSTMPVKKENEEKSILATAKRFQRSAIPRPGQANPYSLAPTASTSSAFSKLMSSHAEDEAWAIAAANEVAARGKPAFQRTCPFYKILPGFFTCVDAFRYGAVEGCNAYFLSHFHSDHYIGLTSSWCHGPIYCSKVTGNLVRQQLRVDPRWVVDLEWEEKTEIPKTEGLFVTMISANHCPGSSLFLFEKVTTKGNGNSKLQRVLHCGDFRACPAHVQHPLLRPSVVDTVTGHTRQQKLDVCYLDTTYLTPKYAFPSQESVIQACADMCISLSKDQADELDVWEKTKKARAGSGMVKFVQKEPNEQAEAAESKGRGRLLVICGTYSIGKERICVGIARALGSKIYAPASKRRICLALEDSELASLLTDDPYGAQIHMQMLMEIRPETLADYLTEYKPHFSRIVGFRPTGWSYRPPNSRFVESPLVQTVLHSDNWKTEFTMAELMPQRGSTRDSSCFGVPYSEHSSFRELTMFCCALRIDKIIPTVNIGSAKSREKMKAWIEKWNNEKKKNGLFKVEDHATAW